MSRVGLIVHAYKANARELTQKLVAWLDDAGHEACLLPEDATALDCPGAAIDAETFSRLDLLVVLGGDGTVLHGIERAGFAGVPILGVNMGRLGFLTEIGPDDVYDALERTLAGGGTLDERSTVQASVLRPGGGIDELGEAINEFSVERGVGGKVIQ